MTDKQWHDLKAIIMGEILSPLPVGFIIDSPWLPNWYGIDILDYFVNDESWFKANMKANETFPDIMFLPGFWAEYGMCSEPSAFGTRCTFPKNEFPHVHKNIHSPDDIERLTKPDPETDGFGPFMLNRLQRYMSQIEDAGHKIRFSVSRGPLNIASYLMGMTEFLTGMMLYPDAIHKLLTVITDYLAEWHALQKATFPTIDGLMMLDDIVGFVGEQEFLEFGYPYLKKLYACDRSVKFFHNDADCEASLKYLPELGINLFNMGYELSLNELRKRTNGKVVMMGNLPPRDVLAKGSPEEVTEGASAMVTALTDKKMVLFSCGGGMPPDVTTENIRAFCEVVRGIKSP